jgi:hypothetical protein
LRSSAAACRRQARSSSPLRGCGGSSLTHGRAAAPKPAAVRKAQHNSQPRRLPGHRVRTARSLDSEGPHGWVADRRCVLPRVIGAVEHLEPTPARVPECETWPIVAVCDRSVVNVERLVVLLPLLKDIGTAGLAPDLVPSGPARVKLLTVVLVMLLERYQRSRASVEKQNPANRRPPPRRIPGIPVLACATWRTGPCREPRKRSALPCPNPACLPFRLGSAGRRPSRQWDTPACKPGAEAVEIT